MSITTIKPKNRTILWGKAAGRCEYDGCNKPLWIDALTKSEFNASYIAHIIADEVKGPRGDPVLSEILKNDISNLMLLCDVHHRLIDIENIEGHTVDRLREMKRQHEERIEILTSISEDKSSHILMYVANIGKNNAKVTWEQAALAMAPNRYPAEKPGFELSLINSLFEDKDESFWEIEKNNLRTQFAQKVKPRLQVKDVKHLSVFAIAPQPLLIELGRLISDIVPTDVYQLHREPKQDWKWKAPSKSGKYKISAPSRIYPTVALNLSLSSNITEKRIQNVFQEEVSIWTLSIETPNNDFMKSQEQLIAFREAIRTLLNQIKLRHGDKNVVHVFPSIPVSVAVELGRVWMPKADLPLRIYDENKGFKFAFEIN